MPSSPSSALRPALPPAIAKREGLVLFVNKATHRLYVYVNRRLQSEYPVSFGRVRVGTPVVIVADAEAPEAHTRP